MFLLLDKSVGSSVLFSVDFMSLGRSLWLSPKGLGVCDILEVGFLGFLDCEGESAIF